MTREVIYLGSTPNDGTGDSLRLAGQKINSNFDEVYSALETFSYTLPPATSSTLGGVRVDGTTIIVNSQGIISATSTVPTNITGNAGTVTNGVYVTGSYADPTWIASLSYSKLTGAPALYTLPVATAATLGGVIVDGTSITINPTTNIIQANAGALAGTALASTIVTIGGNSGTTTVNNSLVVNGNLDVRGSTTYVESTTLQVADKNIELATSSSPTDITADGGGITLRGTTNKTLNWAYASAAWTSSDNLDLFNGKSYKIGGNDVLTANSLGSGVISSSLTSVGTLISLTVGTGGLSVNSPVGIATNQTTFPLINTTATTVNAFGAATAITIGAATGTLSIYNPTITGVNTTALNLNGTNPVIATTGTGTVGVFNTNATTVNIGGAASAINIGASNGTFTIANPTIVGTNATSLNLNGTNPGLVTSNTGTASVFNTNALTVNIAGAATKTNIGAATGYVNVKNSLVVTGASNFTLSNLLVIGTSGQMQCDATVLKVNDTVTISGSLTGTATITGYSNPTTYYIITTDGSTTFTLSLVAGGSAITTTAGTTTGLTAIVNRGAIVIDSSAGITTTQTAINVLNTTATTINAFGASTALSIGSSSGQTTINNNLYGVKQLFVGSGSTSTTLTNPISIFKGTSTTGAGVQYTQAALLNGTTTGSTDFIAYGDNYPGPSNDHGWMDMGFTGSAFNDASYTITGKNDGYIFASAVSGASGAGGNLVLATDSTGSTNDIVLATGGFLSTNEQWRFVNSTGELKFKTPTLTATGTTATVFNTTVTTVNAFGAATSLTIAGPATTLSLGNTATAAQTVNMFTASTGASTYNFATGATAAATTKTINIGTAGLASSTTNINIGSTNGGTIVLSAPTVTISNALRITNAITTAQAAPTIASASTIAPTAPITFISGTTAIATITAPASMASTGGEIVLIPTGLWTTTTAGNIALATTAVVNKALILYYDSGTSKWYPSY